MFTASTGPVYHIIDSIINSLQHPFFMVIFGIFAWFTFLWSVTRDKYKLKNESFIHDQKDEFLVTLVFGFMFLVWDDEIIQAYYDWREMEGEPELKIYYYLAVGPAVDRIYWLYRKATKNEEK